MSLAPVALEFPRVISTQTGHLLQIHSGLQVLMHPNFEVIVIGGGHSGCEAAFAAAKMGCETALLTLDLGRIGVMSCNPAIGGLAKGQLVKEIDAMGGIMGMNTDQSAIQYRRLNSSKGPAVRSSRAQCDKHLYALRMQQFLARVPRLTLISGEVSRILIEKRKVMGVQLTNGASLLAQSVIITTGTFLRGAMYTGFVREEGGRFGDQSSVGLSGSLQELGFVLTRLKTGTPPRLHKGSIDFSKLETQMGDEKPLPFSFYFRPPVFPVLPQVPCFLTYTNPQTHAVIAENFHQSPMFTGVIQGIGPRYCPSVEDKVKRFQDRSRHQIFLEPEGLDVDEVYANGISTSLPASVQEKFVRTISGLEKAAFIRYGYAVEYDCIDARQLRATLESKEISGLFFSGQINGTSGYEEAGAQGLVAGVNAALKVQEKPPFILERSEAYMGVLIDDLVLKGADEPYRMFTSRAEYRLLLREDNADLRLSEKARKLGLLGDIEYAFFEKRRDQIVFWKKKVEGFYFTPEPSLNDWLEKLKVGILKDRVSGAAFLKRPEVDWDVLCRFGFDGFGVSEDVREQVEIQVKYQGYIQREMDSLAGIRKNEKTPIPGGIVYDEIPGLSHEVRDRLKQVRPETLGQASRMVGMTPAAVAQLFIFLKMHPHLNSISLQSR